MRKAILVLAAAAALPLVGLGWFQGQCDGRNPGAGAARRWTDGPLAIPSRSWSEVKDRQQ